MSDKKQIKSQPQSEKPAVEAVVATPVTEVVAEPVPVAQKTVKEENTTVVAEKTSDLKPHQRLELRAFCEQLDEYSKRYEYKTVDIPLDRAAHRKLHGAVRMLLSFDEVVMKEAYAMLLNRMSQKHKFGAFGMPILTKYLHDSLEVTSSAERVFISEFLTITSQFARCQDKRNFRSTTNIGKMLQSISDNEVRKRVDALFPA